MYCLLVILEVFCLVVLLSAILFVVGAAAILVDEGVGSVLRLLAQNVRKVASSSTANPMEWRTSIPDQPGSLISKAGKLWAAELGPRERL